MWNRKSANLNDEVSGVRSLARKLGVERRKNVRVRYPKRSTGPMPSVSFEGRPLRVNDISAGGLNVMDPGEVLGKEIGVQITLTLQFDDGVEEVRCRLVGRVDDRRHIQFLDLSSARSSWIAHHLIPGACGAYLRNTVHPQGGGPALAAKEIWSSMVGDSVVIEEDVYRFAQLTLGGRVYLVHKNAWPQDQEGKLISRETLLGLILFLANVPSPSAALTGLIQELEDRSLDVPPAEENS